MIDAWRLAVGTLTAIPTRPPGAIAPPTARWAMLLAPLAALPLALGAAVGWAALRWTSAPPLLVGILVVAGLALATRGLHLDGLADTCDGLAASYDRTRALEVMRTGDVGPAGAVAIVLVLVIQAAALGDLLTSEPGALVAGLAVVTSRHTLAWACRRGMPAARPGGLGAAVAGTVPVRYAAAATVVVGVFGAGILSAAGLPWWAGPAVVAAGLTGAAVVLRRARRRLGGITGDVLGAVVEIGLAAALAVGTGLI